MGTEKGNVLEIVNISFCMMSPSSMFAIPQECSLQEQNSPKVKKFSCKIPYNKLVDEFYNQLVEDDPTKVEDDPTIVEDDPTIVEDDPTKVEDDPTKVEDDSLIIYNQNFFEIPLHESISERFEKEISKQELELEEEELERKRKEENRKRLGRRIFKFLFI